MWESIAHPGQHHSLHWNMNPELYKNGEMNWEQAIMHVYIHFSLLLTMHVMWLAVFSSLISSSPLIFLIQWTVTWNCKINPLSFTLIFVKVCFHSNKNETRMLSKRTGEISCCVTFRSKKKNSYKYHWKIAMCGDITIIQLKSEKRHKFPFYKTWPQPKDQHPWVISIWPTMWPQGHIGTTFVRMFARGDLSSLPNHYV